MYCLGEENGKYLRNYNISDNYSELLLALKVDIHILMYVSIDLKNDEEIMLVAIKKSILGLRYASPDLQNNKEFVLKAIKYYGWALEMIKKLY